MGWTERPTAATDPPPVAARRLRARRARRLRPPPHGTQRFVAGLHGAAHRVPAAAGRHHDPRPRARGQPRPAGRRSSTRSLSKIPVVGASICSEPGPAHRQLGGAGVGLIGALWGSLRAFVALQTALDDIWEVETGRAQLRRATRLNSLICIAAIGVAQAGIGGARRRRRPRRPAADEPVPADVRRLGAQRRRGRIDLPIHDVDGR